MTVVDLFKQATSTLSAAKPVTTADLLDSNQKSFAKIEAALDKQHAAAVQEAKAETAKAEKAAAAKSAATSDIAPDQAKVDAKPATDATPNVQSSIVQTQTAASKKTDAQTAAIVKLADWTTSADTINRAQAAYAENGPSVDKKAA